ncbi:MerR family transcriptional regulator [Massilia sp. GCM10020059]|uniref:MerR family transcriptional regulator n=1 Tax=Massilia agrisoli TaxID=2892444 RepID=A0ABS8INR9_9BURK|nr:MerR family transcriptional regulator [Massilia agrisoli]MCC6069571.1 MerR family transcriptional regulator [Massilia agrisoli]
MRMEAKDKAEAGQAAYRSGVAARLAGLPVETLRVWERRYGVSDTQRSEHGQRLYSADQVRRLGLLKQLVDQGHPIGSIAGLPADQLSALAAPAAAGAASHAGPVRVAVIGEGLRRRIAADGRYANQLEMVGSCGRLEQAESMLHDIRPEVLLVELSELDDAALPKIAAARQQAGAAATLVMYRFCASATIRELRAQGCLVARVPAELGELVMLCRTASSGKPLLALPAREAVAPRRFDDATLAAYAAAGNRLECECPRHLADLLMMVGSFERYSAQCASRNEADARLHAELEHAAGAARTVLEAAMERLALAEGLDGNRAY